MEYVNGRIKEPETDEEFLRTAFCYQGFILGRTRQPLVQAWQIELFVFRLTHHKPQLTYIEKKERYFGFSNSLATGIAKSIYPVCFALCFIAAALLLAFSNFSFWLWWLGAIAITPLFLISAIGTLRQCIYEIRVKMHESDIATNIHVDNTEGAPGAGKTSSMVNDSRILADMRWSEICQEYKMYKPFLKDIPHWPTRQYEDAMEIIEAYEYYQKTGTYPCLWTTFATFVDGIPANQFTVDHILQRKRIPYGSVIAVDEFNLFIPQNIYRDTPYEIIEISKFCRQWGLTFRIADQATDGTVIYFRRVSGRNRYMIEQEWVLQPRFLKWVLKKIVSSREELTAKQVRTCRILQKIIKASGYRKYYYVDSINERFKGERAKVQTFILNSNLNVEYDDRAFKNLYRCKDQKLEKSAWENLRMSKEELAKIFPEELKQRAKSKAQIKREAEERRLKKKKGEAA